MYLGTDRQRITHKDGYSYTVQIHNASADGAPRQRRLGTSLVTDTPPPSAPPSIAITFPAGQPGPARPGRSFSHEGNLTACAGGRGSRESHGYWPRKVREAEVEVSLQALEEARQASDRRARSIEDGRQERRSKRYYLRKVASEILGRDFKIVTCGQYSLGGKGVELRLDGAQAYYAGVTTCGSFSACPVCAAKIAMKRQALNAELLGKLVAMTDGPRARFSIVFITHTVRHKSKDLFDDVLADLLAIYRSVYSGSPWDKAKKRYGVVGGFRVVETTWGKRSGWHVHSHAVFVVDNTVSSQAPAEMVKWLENRWYDHSTRLDGRNVSLMHGTDGAVLCMSPEELADPKKRKKKVAEAERLADYLSKISESAPVGGDVPLPQGLTREEVLEITYEAGQEVAKEALAGHFKKARMKNLTPFQMLAEIASFKEVDSLGRRARKSVRERNLRYRQLFREYAWGSRGRRFYQTFGDYKGLLELAGMSVKEAEKSDELLASSEGGGSGVTLATLGRDQWRKASHWEVAPKILSMAESVEKNPYMLYSALSYLGVQDSDMEGLIMLCEQKNAEEWESLSPEEKARELAQAQEQEQAGEEEALF